MNHHQNGAHWIPSDVPWNIIPSGLIFSNRSERCKITDEHLTPSQEHGVVSQDKYMELTGSKVVLNLTGADKMKHVRSGDFIIHLRSFQGGIELSNLNGKVSNAYTVLSPRFDINHRYYNYLLKSRPFINGLASLTDQLRDGQSISFTKFSQIKLPLPPIKEQQSIADYLDRETAQIDAMKSAMAELKSALLERKISVIARALDGDYQSIPLTLALERSQTGPFGTQLSAQEYVQGGIPVINPTHIKPDGIYPEFHITISQEKYQQLSNFSVTPGDIILSRKGDVGKSSLIGQAEVPALCGSDSLFLRPNTKIVEPRFLWWWLRSEEAKNHLELNSVGATMSGLNQGVIQLTRIPLPDFDDQVCISNRLDKETFKIDAMIAKAEQLRRLLDERRSALITATVTGQHPVPEEFEA